MTLYFISAGNDLYKIGITSKLSRRIKGIQTGCPFPLEVFHTVQAKKEKILVLEAYFHREYKQKRTTGEWFKLSLSEIDEIKKTSIDDLLLYAHERNKADVLEKQNRKRPQGQPLKFGSISKIRVSFVAPKPLMIACKKYADLHCGGNKSDAILIALQDFLKDSARSPALGDEYV